MGVGKNIAALGMAAFIAREAGNFIPDVPAGVDQERGVVAQTIKGVSDIARAGFDLVVPDAMARECAPSERMRKAELEKAQKDLAKRKLSLEESKGALSNLKEIEALLKKTKDQMGSEKTVEKGIIDMKQAIALDNRRILELNQEIADLKNCPQ